MIRPILLLFGCRKPTMEAFVGIRKNNEYIMRMKWILFLSVAALTACTHVSRFENDSVVAHGELLNGSSELLYFSIEIGVKGPIDPQAMSCLLKLAPAAPPVAISQLRPELVAEYLLPFSPPPQWPEKWKRKALEDEAYSGNGFLITFKDGVLQSIGICSHCEAKREYPTIGTPDGQHFYSLPLTLEQLIEVFGHPARIDKVHEVYY